MAKLLVKLRDFLKLENMSGDICDNYDDSLDIYYESGYVLTKEGERKFKDILDLDVEIRLKAISPFSVQIAHVYEDWQEPQEDTEEFERLLNKHGDVAHPLHWLVYELFEGLAGYCSVEDYDKWFRKVVE